MAERSTSRVIDDKNRTVVFLRGVAALWVVVAHCAIWGGYKYWIPDPKVAVDIFMMISGYLMMWTADNLHRDEPLTNMRSWKTFYVRRYFRISPVYYVALACVVILGDFVIAGKKSFAVMNHNPYLGELITDHSPLNIFYHLTYIHGLIPDKASSTRLPDWSLSLEMQFYLIFPLIYGYLRKFKTSMNLVLFTICIIAVSFASKLLVIPYFTEVSPIIYQLPFFLLGILVQYLSTTQNTTMRRTTLLLIGLIGIYSIVIKIPQNVFLVLASGLLLLSTISQDQLEDNKWRKPRRFQDWLFGHKFFDFLSDVSYPVYLFHGFFLSIVGSRIEQWLYSLGFGSSISVTIIALIVIPLTYLTAVFVNRFIERPGIKLGKTVIKRMKSGWS